MTVPYLFAVLVLVSIITYALRAAPFALLRHDADHPVMRDVGRMMPLGVMVILIVYSLMEVNFSQLSGWVPALVSVAVAFTLHLTLKNTMVTIVAATASYGLLGWLL